MVANAEIEAELKILKNQIREALSDIREYLELRPQTHAPAQTLKPVAQASVTTNPAAQQPSPAADQQPASAPQPQATQQSPVHPTPQPPQAAPRVPVQGPVHVEGGDIYPASSMPGWASPPRSTGEGERGRVGESSAYAHREVETLRDEEASASEGARRRKGARDAARGETMAERYAPSRNGHSAHPDSWFNDDQWVEESRPRYEAERRFPTAAQGSREHSQWPAEAPADRHNALQRLDLLTIAMMAPWIEEGIKKIGRSRLKKIVDVYVTMHGISLEVRDTVQTLIGLDNTQELSGAAPIAESMRVLAELDLLWSRKDDTDDAGRALLAAYLAGRQRAD